MRYEFRCISFVKYFGYGLSRAQEWAGGFETLPCRHEMQTNKLTLIAASNEFWTVLPPE